MSVIQYWSYTPTQYQQYLKAAKAIDELLNDDYLKNAIPQELRNKNGYRGLLVDILTPQIAKPFAVVDLDERTVFWAQRKETIYKRLKNKNLILTSDAANAAQMSLESVLTALHVDKHLQPTDDYFEYQQSRIDFKQMLNVESTQTKLNKQYPELNFKDVYTLTVTDTLLEPLITDVHRKLGHLFPKDEELQVAFIRTLFNTTLKYRVSFMEFNKHCMPTIQVPAPNMIVNMLNFFLADDGRFRLELWHNHHFERITAKDVWDLIASHANDKNIIPFVKLDDLDNQKIYHYQTTLELKKLTRDANGEESIDSSDDVNFAMNSGHPAKLDKNNQMTELYQYDDDGHLVVKNVKNSGIYLVDLDQPHSIDIESKKLEIKIPATKKSKEK